MQCSLTARAQKAPLELTPGSDDLCCSSTPYLSSEASRRKLESLTGCELSKKSLALW